MKTNFSQQIPLGGDWVEYRQTVSGGAPETARINRRTGEYIVIHADGTIARRGFDQAHRQQILLRFTKQ